MFLRILWNLNLIRQQGQIGEDFDFLKILLNIKNICFYTSVFLARYFIIKFNPVLQNLDNYYQIGFGGVLAGICLVFLVFIERREIIGLKDEVFGKVKGE